MRDFRFGNAFAWKTTETIQFEPSDFVPTVHLNSMLVKELSSLLQDKHSFIFRPIPERNDLVPAEGVRVLLNHLKRRDADRAFCLKWLSKIHARGVEQEIFRAEYRFVNASKKKS